jgi:hypothetical protein
VPSGIRLVVSWADEPVDTKNNIIKKKNGSIENHFLLISDTAIFI